MGKAGWPTDRQVRPLTWFGCLLVFLSRGRTPLVYCGAFVVTSYLELYGTGLGTWAWQPHDPTGLISIGNPPSGIAGGYCFFDAAALWLTPPSNGLLPSVMAWATRVNSDMKRARSGGGSTPSVRANAAIPPGTGTSSLAATAAAGST